MQPQGNDDSNSGEEKPVADPDPIDETDDSTPDEEELPEEPVPTDDTATPVAGSQQNELDGGAGTEAPGSDDSTPGEEEPRMSWMGTNSQRTPR